MNAATPNGEKPRMERLEYRLNVLLAVAVAQTVLLTLIFILAVWPSFFADLGRALSEDVLKERMTQAFQPVLKPLFNPVNNVLTPLYMPWARIVAVGFFILTMVWVGAILNRAYVHLERPNKHWYSDLRIWTVVSMLPHVFVYLYF